MSRITEQEKESLQAAITRHMFDRVGGLHRDYSYAAQKMTESKAKAEKLMILEMQKVAFEYFYNEKMRQIKGYNG